MKKVKEVEVENIIIGHEYTNFADKYSKEDLLMALTLAVTSSPKFISPKDIRKSVDRIVTNKKCLKIAFELSENYLKFITKNFIGNK